MTRQGAAALLQVDLDGRGDADRVDAGMQIEPPVLGRQERLDHMRRKCRYGDRFVGDRPVARDRRPVRREQRDLRGRDRLERLGQRRGDCEPRGEHDEQGKDGSEDAQRPPALAPPQPVRALPPAGLGKLRLRLPVALGLPALLYLTLQVLECGFPTVLGLNMMDEARELGLAIDSAGLSEALGVPVVEMVARRREGMEALSDAILAVLDDDPPPPPALVLPRLGVPFRAAVVAAGDDSVGADDAFLPSYTSHASPNISHHAKMAFHDSYSRRL